MKTTKTNVSLQNVINSPIDCRSEEGVTIGLIDSLISISRVLAKRDFNTPQIREALKDLYNDEDLKYILMSESDRATFIAWKETYYNNKRED